VSDFYADLVAYMSGALGRRTRLDDEPAWQVREERSVHVQAHLGVAAGAVDASSKDSTVLETEFLHASDLRRHVRVMTTLRPSPIPPLVVTRRLPLALCNELWSTVLEMHRDPRARGCCRAAVCISSWRSGL
jgi:hypothetical protein